MQWQWLAASRPRDSATQVHKGFMLKGVARLPAGWGGRIGTARLCFDKFIKGSGAGMQGKA